MKIEDLKGFNISGDGSTIQIVPKKIDEHHMEVTISIHPNILETLMEMQDAIEYLRERDLDTESDK